MASTITPIVGARLGGSDAWSGVPSAVYQLGAAVAAVLWGRAMETLGRRPTLMLGMASGTAGAFLACAAVSAQRLPPFLCGVLLMGVAQAALQLGRFVSAEVHLPASRGRAIARVVLGGTVGAVVGPLLVAPASGAAAFLGVDPLAGPFAASGLLFVAVAGVLALLLHPEPRELARLVTAAAAGEGDAGRPERRPTRQILSDPLVVLAMATMICGQVVMVMLMVVTAVHMTHHDHPLSSISAVLSSHVFGMFAFSLVSGRLTDALGRQKVIALGAAILLVSCVLAPLSASVGSLAASLLLLGLGWNLCYVGGSSLLADRLTPGERARTQGFNDFLMGSVSAAGSLTSGLVFAHAGYSWMAGAGAVLSAALFALGWVIRARPVPGAGR